MSQLFLATGPDSDELKRLSRAAVRLFAGIAQITPLKLAERDGVAMAIFDSAARAGAARICEDENGVAAGVGSWLFNGGAQGNLKPLITAAASRPDAFADILERYDGFFGFVVATARNVKVVTDPLGRLHLYEARLGRNRLVSTSSLVLAALLGASWEPAAVREFLALGYVLGHHSLFKGVHKLPPATISARSLRDPDRASDTIYWRLGDWVYEGGGCRGADSVEALADTLQASMRSIFDAYPRPVMDLTGGFDSRALLGAALGNYPVSRFGTAVSGDRASGDVVAARVIADRYGLTHRELAPRPHGAAQWWELAKQAVPLVDGEYDVLEYASILNIHSGLATQFDASVNGSGGEVCRGYWWELLLPFIGWHGHFDAQRVASARFATDDWAEGMLAEQFDQTLNRHVAESLNDADDGLSNGLNTARMDNIYLTVRMQRWQGRIASATNRLWPCFSPFLMKGPLQVALGATVKERLADRMPRRLIQRFDPELAALPMASGLPASPITWGSAYRFHRLPGQWGARAWHKANRMLGRRHNAVRQSGVSVTALLWKHAPFRDWWSRTQIQELFRDEAFERFLQQSRRDEFADAAHFGRLVTLELVARTLKVDA